MVGPVYYLALTWRYWRYFRFKYWHYGIRVLANWVKFYFKNEIILYVLQIHKLFEAGKSSQSVLMKWSHSSNSNEGKLSRMHTVAQ